MELFQEYKELYYHEIQHSDRLNSKISTSLTLLTILGTGQIFLWKDLTLKSHIQVNINLIDWNFTIYALLCVISLYFFVRSISSFTQSYSGYDYDYFPIYGFKTFVDNTYKVVQNNPDANKIAEDHINSMMKRAFISCAIHNREQNNHKNQNHRKTNILIIRSFITLAFTFSYWIIFICNIAT